MEIIPYSDKHFASLTAFLKNNWAPSHSIYSKCLFDWQYGGPVGKASASLLLLDGTGAIQGFLGVIPYSFLFRGDKKDGAGLAVWVVDKGIKNSGAGLYMRKEIEGRFDVVYTIGLNLETIHYYQKRQYQYYDSLHRYVIPLEAEGYQRLLAEPCASGDVAAWAASIAVAPLATPVAGVDAAELENAYQHGVAFRFPLCPLKDAKFWEWRYLNSKGFEYLFFRAEGGIVVCRVEETHALGERLRHGLRCLRIIEILPADGAVWDGKDSPSLVEAILSVLAWARDQGCVLADFQISNSRLRHILTQAGFRLQESAGTTNIARLFAPFRENAKPLNFTYRVLDSEGFAEIDREDTYIVKSDTDMDRPNYLNS